MLRTAHTITCAALLLAALWTSLVCAEQGAAYQPPEIVVPEGFVAELAAAPPLVRHPVMANFDERGRLFIAETAGKNLKRAELEKQLPNFVRLLQDTDGDGVFDKSTIFADKMTFPQGALWYRGALYVCSPPGLWRLEDTDDDGVADKREQIVGGFNYTGNAADIHGPFLGPCGRIWWCDGRHGHEIRDADGRITNQGKAACIFSCRPDGSDVQRHCGGGMDNPVEVDFMPTGEVVGTVNLFYRQRGDCLVHWMHGGVYPRYDQPKVIAEFPRTGDLLIEVGNLGHVAVSGMTRYRGDTWGEDFRDNLFITEFNTHNVKRVSLNRYGGTYQIQMRDFNFVRSPSSDFHPTDVLQDADGSLLVIDTGGWFRIGCPTSQIAKPNVLGAIWRIRRKDARPPADPRDLKLKGTLKLAWKDRTNVQLADLLADDRFSVRERALDQLAQRGDDALPALSAAVASKDPHVRRRAVWTLARIDSAAARGAIRARLWDENADVRLAALTAIAAGGDVDAADAIIRQIDPQRPAELRAAATALGRTRFANAVPVLLDWLRHDTDRVTEHALIYALIEIDNAELTAAGLKYQNAKARRGALIALSQMKSGRLAREDVLPLLNSDDFPLQQAALETISQRPEWGKEIDAWLRGLIEKKPQGEQLAALRGALLAFCSEDAVRDLITQQLDSDTTDRHVRLAMLDVAARCGLDPLPTDWQFPLAELLESRDPQFRLATITVLSETGTLFGDMETRLGELAGMKEFSTEIRLAAAGALGAHHAKLNNDAVVFLLATINSESPPTQRLQAARALGSADLSAEQLQRVAIVVGKVGPLEMTPLLSAFEKSRDKQLGLKLVAQLKSSPMPGNLSAAQLAELLKPYPEEVHQAAAPLLEKLNLDNREQAEKLAQLVVQLGDGDAARGKEIFFGRRAACAACHAIGGTGGQIGPDLTAISARRNRRDLLEAIVFPSSSLARGFESYSITTNAGKVYSGVITRQTPAAIHLRTTKQEELRLPHSAIEQMVPSAISVMPQGLDQTIGQDDLRHLIAYLESLR